MQGNISVSKNLGLLRQVHWMPYPLYHYVFKAALSITLSEARKKKRSKQWIKHRTKQPLSENTFSGMWRTELFIQQCQTKILTGWSGCFWGCMVSSDDSWWSSVTPEPPPGWMERGVNGSSAWFSSWQHWPYQQHWNWMISEAHSNQAILWTYDFST